MSKTVTLTQDTLVLALAALNACTPTGGWSPQFQAAKEIAETLGMDLRSKAFLSQVERCQETAVEEYCEAYDIPSIIS